MVDKVRPLKLESSTSGGTDLDPFPTEVNTAQDYVATKGIAFENNDNRLFDLSGSGEIQYKDAIQTAYLKLNDIGALAFAARFTISLQHNGTVGGGTFLGYNELIPGNSTPVIVPSNSVFKGFTFSNNSAAADYTLEIRQNTQVGTPLYTISKVNTQFFSQTGLNFSFTSGDQIFVKYVDDGGNAADVGMNLIFQAV